MKCIEDAADAADEMGAIPLFTNFLSIEASSIARTSTRTSLRNGQQRDACGGGKIGTRRA
jgi:hypothetical protein